MRVVVVVVVRTLPHRHNLIRGRRTGTSSLTYDTYALDARSVLPPGPGGAGVVSAWHAGS